LPLPKGDERQRDNNRDLCSERTAWKRTRHESGVTFTLGASSIGRRLAKRLLR
jgi:hypothetical protein